MIRSFRDQGAENIYNGDNTKKARRTCPQSIWSVARRKLDQLDSAESLNDLRIPPGNKLKELGGHRAGQHNIRITTSIGFAFTGQSQGRPRLKLPTITRSEE